MFSGNNHINPFALAERINRPLILDGAMGSLLQQSGIKSGGPMWMSLVNIRKPEAVINIHRKYIEAGADIITTNTFRTNPAAVNKYNSRINLNNLVKKSVRLAVEAAGDLPVFIAGSNAPAEDCYQRQRKLSLKELKLNHHKHIDLLYENGSDFILNETHSHMDEIKIICDYCSGNDIPYVMSLFTDEKFRLLSGEKFSEAVNLIKNYNPLAIGINCVFPATFFRHLKKEVPGYTWGTYLNCGSGEFKDENITCGIGPGEYAVAVSRIMKYSPSFIGACCGSGPEHIKKIKRLLDGKNNS